MTRRQPLCPLPGSDLWAPFCGSRLTPSKTPPLGSGVAATRMAEWLSPTWAPWASPVRAFRWGSLETRAFLGALEHPCLGRTPSEERVAPARPRRSPSCGRRRCRRPCIVRFCNEDTCPAAESTSVARRHIRRQMHPRPLDLDAMRKGASPIGRPHSNHAVGKDATLSS